MALQNLHDLMLEQLRDVYSAEKQILKALPSMIEAATDDELRTALDKHLTITEGHVKRLDSIFEDLAETPRAKKCKAMEGLLEEGSEILEEEGVPDVLDAGIIASAQRVEHYEIAAYGTVLAYARQMQHSNVADLLGQTLEEEKEADMLLTRIAHKGMKRMPLMNASQGARSDRSDEEEPDVDSDEASRSAAKSRRAPASRKRSLKQR